MRSPAIIMGTGGSGTRVLADILNTAGYFMGSERNRAGDSLSFHNFFESNVNSYLRHTGWLRGVTQAGTYMGRPDMQHDFEAALTKHKGALPAGKQAWGWKAPRSIFLHAETFVVALLKMLGANE